MNPSPPGQPLSEKDADIEAHLAPPYYGPPGYSALCQPPINVISQDSPRNACRRRFWHFVACTFLLSCTLYVILQRMHLDPTYPFKHTAPAVGPNKCSDQVSWEQVPDVPSGYLAHLRTSVTLPVADNILSVITEGARTHGSLEVSQTADAGSDAVVEVDVFYRDQADFDEATVCRLHPSSNEWGLGIFTPSSRWGAPPWHWFHQLRFEVHVRLPANPSLTVTQLKTDLHSFSQHLNALADSVHFDRLSLKSTNGEIVADSVAGDRLELHTSNGAIVGQFKTTSQLHLESSNGHLNANVSLLPDGTGNENKTGGPYHVTTETTNGAIDLAFVSAPPTAHTLTASARTSNAPVAVLAQPFEGAFDLHTPDAKVLTPGWPDPARRGRKRAAWVVPIGDGLAGVHGNAYWSEENQERGRLSVWTSNAGVQLTL